VQDKLTNQSSMASPAPVSDGAAAKGDNSLLSHSSISQASSPRAVDDASDIGQVIINRIIQSGSIEALYKDLGDEGTLLCSSPCLLTFESFTTSFPDASAARPPVAEHDLIK
jgi:hypothetical protein